MLLSFAQFEREVTGERIRDKIAASKRKGIWMGGTVPLDYDVVERRLVVNEGEAKLVRHIMQRYIALGSVAELIAELDREGYRTKVQIRTSGPHKGGCPFRRGTIYHLLSNRIYRGLIIRRGEAFPGDHEAIVSDDLWEAVQHTIAERSNGGASRATSKHPSLLVGRIVDGLGRPMTLTHAQKGKPLSLLCDSPRCSRWTCPAAHICFRLKKAGLGRGGENAARPTAAARLARR